MTVGEFLDWSGEQPGRHELLAGEPVAMAPERVRHGEVKLAVATAFLGGVRRACVTCHVLPDGMTVAIDGHTAYEPDALVYCGERLQGHVIVVPEPVIIAEVASPSTRGIDAGVKLEGYFSLPSVVHYLIVDPERRTIIHHLRQPGGSLGTNIVNRGTLRLDPPGIEFEVADIFGV
jgi:Uma2 family endonuclease